MISEYIGGGEVGTAFAQLDALKREQRKLARAELRAKRAATAALEQELDEVSSIIQTVLDAVLLTNGYHQHQRQWRRQRGRSTERD